MYWAVLLFACLTEICWALTLKAMSKGPTPAMIGLSAFLTVFNMVLLTFAMRGIPASMAYAVWTGLGAAGLTAVGIYYFDEPITPVRLVCLAAIIAGVVGLKMSG